jgi:hypothetical protein
MISVFLSSTFQDFTQYRDEIGKALAMTSAESLAAVQARRLEHAVGGYDDAIKVCRRELGQCDAFMLMYAHWYGWIPNTGSPSITHLEFEWAWDRWKDQKYRPIAVLIPIRGTPADFELKEQAQKLLQGATPEYQREHPRRIAEFHARVTQSGNTVMTFDTLPNAVMKATIACLKWNGNTAMHAAKNGGARGGDEELLSDRSLGGLGRKPQLDAFELEISRLESNTADPGAAFLIAGKEDAGHRHFLRHLIDSEAFPRGRPAKLEWLHDCSADRLAPWAGLQLGFGDDERTETIPELAVKLAGEMQRQHLSLVVGGLEKLQGGVPAFQQLFWKPLYEALAELKARLPFKYRLLAITAAHEKAKPTWEKAASRHHVKTAPTGYDRLLLLPELGEIKADHLALWMKKNRVVEAQRNGALTSVMDGKSAVSAWSAYERLKLQALRCERG